MLRAYRGARRVASGLPVPAGDLAARGVGRAMAHAMRGRRRVVARHLRRASDWQLSGTALDAAVDRAFESYARYWAESLRLDPPSLARLERHFTRDGDEHLYDALTAGSGVIAVTPHLGSWDFAAAWCARTAAPVTAIVERLDPPELFDWFVDLRETLGVRVVAHDDPGVASVALGALRDNHVLALVSDRDLAGTGIEVEFFGETTTLPAGPATLSLRSGAPIVPLAVYQGRRPRSHHAVLLPPLDTTRQDRLRDDVARVTQDMASALEDLVRRAPEQWHLFQPNWPSDHVALTR